MSEQDERRCLGCHKRLLNEAVPYCYRCRLEGLKTAGYVAGGVVAGVGLLCAKGITTAINAALGGSSTDGDES